MDNIKNFEVGFLYRYSQLPEDSTDDYEVTDHGEDLLGQNAIHIRIHEDLTDIWFIWVSYGNEAVYKCVYKN